MGKNTTAKSEIRVNTSEHLAWIVESRAARIA